MPLTAKAWKDEDGLEYPEIDGLDVPKMLDDINSRIELLYDRDHQIGHSYFIGVDSLEKLRDVFLSKVIPLLQEYFYDDWQKICLVLGCPHRWELAHPEPRKGFPPMVEVTKLTPKAILGVDDEECEEKMRCEVNRAFRTAEGEGLIAFFEGVVAPVPTASSGTETT